MQNAGVSFYSEEFLGANTHDGFISQYKQFIDGFVKRQDNGFVYVIKGGPGSGKSTFIKKVRNILSDNGYDVGVIRCSGDVESLDGVYSEQAGIMVVDGTAPHCVETDLAGIDGKIINFGDFWDLTKLKNVKNEIIRHAEQKKKAYICSYGFLGAAKHIKDIAYETNRHNFNFSSLYGEIDDAVNEIIVSHGENRRSYGNVIRSYATACTSEGVSGSVFDSMGNDYRDYDIIGLKYPAWFNASDLFRCASDRLMRAGYNIREFLCGFDGYKLEHIVIPSAKTAIISINEYCEMPRDLRAGKTIDVSTFLIEKKYYKEKNCENLLRCRLKYDEMLVKASFALKDAAMQHKALEEYYIEAMRFDLLNEYSSIQIEEIKKRIL